MANIEQYTFNISTDEWTALTEVVVPASNTEHESIFETSDEVNFDQYFANDIDPENYIEVHVGGVCVHAITYVSSNCYGM